MNFEVGQKWTFRCDPVDAGATLGIGRIVDDPMPKGAAIHVWVEGIGGKRPELSGGVAAISHTPIARASLEESVLELVAQGVAVPDNFESDYQGWLTTEGAGVWTTTVEEIIAIVRRGMEQRSLCSMG